MFEKSEKLPIKPSQDETQFLMECGYLCQDLGRSQEATDIFLGVSALRPDDPLPAASIGAVLLSTGQVDEAVDHLQKVLTAFPEDPLTMAHLGEAMVCRKEIEEAKTTFKKVLEKDSDGPAGDIARTYMEFVKELEKL